MHHRAHIHKRTHAMPSVHSSQHAHSPPAGPRASCQRPRAPRHVYTRHAHHASQLLLLQVGAPSLCQSHTTTPTPYHVHASARPAPPAPAALRSRPALVRADPGESKASSSNSPTPIPVPYCPRRPQLSAQSLPDVTACMASARRPTFLVLTPAMEMRPLRVM